MPFSRYFSLPVAVFQLENFIERLLENGGNLQAQDRGGHVFFLFYRHDCLAGDVDQVRQLLLSQVFDGALHLDD
jgi:hypothetical protein